jgi:hypothetical protein
MRGKMYNYYKELLFEDVTGLRMMISEFFTKEQEEHWLAKDTGFHSK